jgi:uncharacterized membrane protein YhiD involved in acid resistance
MNILKNIIALILSILIINIGFAIIGDNIPENGLIQLFMAILLFSLSFLGSFFFIDYIFEYIKPEEIKFNKNQFKTYANKPNKEKNLSVKNKLQNSIIESYKKELKSYTIEEIELTIILLSNKIKSEEVIYNITSKETPSYILREIVKKQLTKKLNL